LARHALFHARERAALEWTETLTLIAQSHVSDEVFQRTIKEFDVQELVDLTYAVVAIMAGIGWLSQCARFPVNTSRPKAITPRLDLLGRVEIRSSNLRN